MALNFMACWRLLPILIITLSVILVVIYVILNAIISGQRTSMERVNRLPGVRDFLKNRSRSFNPNAVETDKKLAEDNESCAICMEEYQEGDGTQNGKSIVELSCKHVFHAKCMEEWAEKNDICPMCRLPILNQDQEA